MVIQRRWVADNPHDENSGFWELEVGLRYSDEEKKQYANAPATAPPFYTSSITLTPNQQWRCSECVVNQIFGFNPADTPVCLTCGQNVTQCGHTVWVKYEHLNNLTRREVDSRYSPKIVSLLHTRWPFTEIECGKKPPTI